MSDTFSCMHWLHNWPHFAYSLNGTKCNTKFSVLERFLTTIVGLPVIFSVKHSSDIHQENFVFLPKLLYSNASSTWGQCRDASSLPEVLAEAPWVSSFIYSSPHFTSSFNKPQQTQFTPVKKKTNKLALSSDFLVYLSIHFAEVFFPPLISAVHQFATFWQREGYLDFQAVTKNCIWILCTVFT